MKTRQPPPVSTTAVSSRYQTVIPADVRERFCIREGTRIAWVVRDDIIEVIPLPEKPWQEFRGSGRGVDYMKALAGYRAQERALTRAGGGRGDAAPHPREDKGEA